MGCPAARERQKNRPDAIGRATLIWQVGTETSWIFYRIYEHDERLDSIDDYCISKSYPILSYPILSYPI